MTPFVDDTDFTLYVGDVRDVLATMPAESVHCVVTSPPYWWLRDYGSEGQLGLEPTPEEYVANMVAVFREVRRVLRRNGTCWLNIGDSYASGEIGRHDRSDGYDGEFSRASTQGARRQMRAQTGLKPKDLVGIPWRLAFALQADGWYLRSDMIWSKPNPMPESVTDRPTKAHEYLFLLTRSPRYFYDADAIREPHAETDRMQSEKRRAQRMGRSVASVNGLGQSSKGIDTGLIEAEHFMQTNPAGRNRRSVWEIPTEPYPDAHFATFPQALVEPCVLAGTSERGCCLVCGAPWERETVEIPATDALRSHGSHPGAKHLQGPASRLNSGTSEQYHANRRKVETTGWRPTCDHDRTPVPCTVLDPFMGSGTTAVVARRLGRKSIGIELNAEYANLAARRMQQLSLLA